MLALLCNGFKGKIWGHHNGLNHLPLLLPVFDDCLVIDFITCSRTFATTSCSTTRQQCLGTPHACECWRQQAQTGGICLHLVMSLL